MKFPPFPFTSSCFLHSASYNENSCLLERKRFFKVRSIKWIPLHVVKPSHSSVVSMFKWHLIKGGGMKTRSFSLPDKNSRLHVRFMIVNSSPARPVCITLIFKAKKWYVKQIFTLRCQSISRHNVEGVFWVHHVINTLSLRQNCHHFPDDIFKWILKMHELRLKFYWSLFLGSN